MKRLLSFPWRLAKSLLTWVVALWLVFEEWGWEPLSRWLGLLARLPGIAFIERRLAALPPRWALWVFFVPALLLLPIKIAALWLIGRGRPITGLLVIVAAKLIGTALVARLFMLTQPQLMKMAWFARLYARWTAWKNIVLTRVRDSLAWRWARAWKRRLRIFWQRAGRTPP